MRKFIMILGASAMLALGVVATNFAVAQPGQSPGHPAPAPQGRTQGQPQAPQAQGNAAASTRAFRAVTEKMHSDMNISFTGNADRDFANLMIRHHQSAIDMARVALEHARETEIRNLAETIVRDQEREIAQMRAFLARTPSR